MFRPRFSVRNIPDSISLDSDWTKMTISITTPAKYYAVPMGYDTPDFDTELTIFENGDFKSGKPYSETSYIRSWFYEQYPNGSFALTITVKSNNASNYDIHNPDLQLVDFLKNKLSDLQRTERFEWPPRR